MWSSDTLPPLAFRLSFLIAVLAPLLQKEIGNFPCILSLFVIVSANRYMPSFMPFLPDYLLVATLIMRTLVKYKSPIKAPRVVFFLVIVTLLVDMLHSGAIQSVSITLLILALFFGFIDDDISQRWQYLAGSFIIISIVLCLETFIYRSEITYTLEVGMQDYNRIGWNDPNYFTAVFGMGAIAAFQILMYYNNLTRKLRHFLIGVILLVLTVSLLVASRGGIAAILGSFATLFLLSRKKNKNASSIFLILLIFGIVLYQFGAFDILLARVASDEGELGGRSVIWVSKLNDFSSSASILDWVFGLGHSGGLSVSNYLGGDKAIIGFHNDFLAILISYGIVGLTLFVIMLLYPIIKYRTPSVTAGVVYLSLISLSLEPFSAGGLDFCYFYFYLCVLGHYMKYADTNINYKTI